MQDTEKIKFIDTEIRNNIFIIIIPLIFLIIWGIQGNGWIIVGIESIIAITVLIVGIVRGISLGAKKRELLLQTSSLAKKEKVSLLTNEKERVVPFKKGDLLALKWALFIGFILVFILQTSIIIFAVKKYALLLYSFPIWGIIFCVFFLIFSIIEKK